ncbi:RDD family protein [Metamycoplasma hominis]|uniref:RDD family protein n=1 Tax=Metamycoplasma hominis TaxID=2098 RepID=UPI000DCC899F|nr:RDD family protein [Metamycoplasma hominis]RAW47288.1 RDD family protein [Metamycoplasma hominis]
MIKINIKANFWIRLAATLIDFLVFIGFLIGSSFAIFNYKEAKFYNYWSYYLWIIMIILVQNIIWIIVPIFTKGYTLGLFICRLKIIKQQNNKSKLSKVIFDRQRLFSFIWMIIFALFMVFISPQTFEQAANLSQTKPLDQLQKAFLSIPSVLSALATFLEFLFILSNAKGDRIGLNDKFSGSYTVWAKKYEDIEENNIDNLIIKPIVRELPKIDYK